MKRTAGTAPPTDAGHVSDLLDKAAAHLAKYKTGARGWHALAAFDALNRAVDSTRYEPMEKASVAQFWRLQATVQTALADYARRRLASEKQAPDAKVWRDERIRDAVRAEYRAARLALLVWLAAPTWETPVNGTAGKVLARAGQKLKAEVGLKVSFATIRRAWVDEHLPAHVSAILEPYPTGFIDDTGRHDRELLATAFEGVKDASDRPGQWASWRLVKEVEDLHARAKLKAKKSATQARSKKAARPARGLPQMDISGNPKT